MVSMSFLSVEITFGSMASFLNNGSWDDWVGEGGKTVAGTVRFLNNENLCQHIKKQVDLIVVLDSKSVYCKLAFCWIE
jgi:hypothetical protein